MAETGGLGLFLDGCIVWIQAQSWHYRIYILQSNITIILDYIA